MKLILDMNLSPIWVGVLVKAGISSVHWSTLGAFDASDVTIMSYAREHDYVVLSHDLDFSAILAATNGDKPSVVQIRSDDLNPANIGPQVILALNQMSAELEKGALVVVEPERIRLRVLPLRARI